MTRNLILAFVALLSVNSFNAVAAGSSVKLDVANNRLGDAQSLRRGAKLFVQRCSSCHSVKYIRYSDIAEGLGWTEDEVDKEMIFGRAKFHDIMLGGMDDKAAKQIYGTVIPDLSLVAKSRGADWLYSYLRAYYTDKSGKTDNFVFPGVAMPNMLAADQGPMRPIYAEVNGRQVVVGTEPKNDPATFANKIKLEKKRDTFNQKVRDIVNFLEFASEPNKLERFSLGVKVILFLIFLSIILFFLKKEYWRDIK